MLGARHSYLAPRPQPPFLNRRDNRRRSGQRAAADSVFEDVVQLQLLVTGFDRPVGIDQREFAVFNAQDGDVGVRTNLQRAEFLAATQETGWFGGRPPNDVVDAHSQMQELVERCQQVEDRAVDVVSVDVAAEEMRHDALLHQSVSDRKAEAPGAMTEIEQDTSLQSVASFRQQLQLVVNEAAAFAVKAVCQDVAWSESFQNLRCRQCGIRTVNDQRHASDVGHE